MNMKEGNLLKAERVVQCKKQIENITTSMLGINKNESFNVICVVNGIHGTRYKIKDIWIPSKEAKMIKDIILSCFDYELKQQEEVLDSLLK